MAATLLAPLGSSGPAQDMDLASSSSQEQEPHPELQLNVFDDGGAYHPYYGDISPFDFNLPSEAHYQEPYSINISPSSCFSLSPGGMINAKSSSWSEGGLCAIDSIKPRSPSSLFLRAEGVPHVRRYSEPREPRRHTVFVHPNSPTISDASTKSGKHSASGYSCPHCKTICFRKAELQRHLEKHSRQYPCKECSRTFRNKADLHRHVREVHEEREDLKSINVCPVPSCERNRTGFARRWNLADHYRRRHGGGILPSSSGELAIVIGKDTSQQYDDDNSVRSSCDSAIIKAEDAEIMDEDISSPLPSADKGDVATTPQDFNSRPMRRGQSSDRVRSKIEKELRELRMTRRDIDNEIGRLEHALARLD